MTVLRSLALAIALFTRIPMPTPAWERANMRYALAALPLVGVVVALPLGAWLWLCDAGESGTVLFAAGLTLLPVLVTGGIHLDGLCDTVDALSSRAAPERKRAILKDPHVGAFAAIGVAVYLLAYFALCTELNRDAATILLLGVSAVMSRALASFASLAFPVSGTDGILGTLRDASAKPAAIICALWFFLAVLAGFFIDGRATAAMAGAALLVALYVSVMARRQFGGMSGDLAGYFIALAELAALAALALSRMVW
jgi:adenosylcobinamide-GDP ribazoletransferase